MGKPASSGLAATSKAANSTDRANSVVEGTFAGVGPGLAFPVWGPMNFYLYTKVADALSAVVSGTNAGTLATGTNVHNGDSVNSTLVPPGTTIASGGTTTSVTFAFPTQMWSCVLRNSATINFSVIAPDSLPVGLTLSKLVGATVSDPNGYFGSGVTVLAVGDDGVSLLLSAPPLSIPTTPGPVPVLFALTANCLTTGSDLNATFTGATPTFPSTLTINLERSVDGGVTFIPCNVGFGNLAQIANPTVPYSIAFGDPEAGALYRANCIAYSGGTSGVTTRYRFSTTGQAGVILQSPAIS